MGRFDEAMGEARYSGPNHNICSTDDSTQSAVTAVVCKEDRNPDE